MPALLNGHNYLQSFLQLPDDEVGQKWIYSVSLPSLLQLLFALQQVPHGVEYDPLSAPHT